MINMLFKIILLIKTLSDFPIAFLDKLGVFKGELVYKIRNKNMQFIARAGTEDMAEVVVVTSGYEYDLNNVKLPKKPVIVDLGGHIGTFSISMARRLKDKCKIYTYEPDKENYGILIRNIALNKIHSVYSKNVAISDYVGKGYLEKENMNTDAYHLGLSKKKNTNCVVNTLSQALRAYKIKKIDLLKMDIEGGEYKIFLHKQSFDYIQKTVHYIFMEYHDIDDHYNYFLIKRKLEEKFFVINKRANIITLENSNWKRD
jgi:FkbM family methyltransferase